VEHAARMGEMRNANRNLVGRREGKRTLVRPRGRWLNSIKMNLQETECEDFWLDLCDSASIGPSDGYCEHGNESSAFLKRRDSFHCLLKRDSSALSSKLIDTVVVHMSCGSILSFRA